MLGRRGYPSKSSWGSGLIGSGARGIAGVGTGAGSEAFAVGATVEAARKRGQQIDAPGREAQPRRPWTGRARRAPADMAGAD